MGDLVKKTVTVTVRIQKVRRVRCPTSLTRRKDLVDDAVQSKLEKQSLKKKIAGKIYIQMYAKGVPEWKPLSSENTDIVECPNYLQSNWVKTCSHPHILQLGALKPEMYPGQPREIRVVL